MIDFRQIRTFPIAERKNKFSIDRMLVPGHRPSREVPGISPLADRIKHGRDSGGLIIAMLGGAVIKEGCSLLLIDLMKKGWIHHVAGNGSVSIHDFELALTGETSEDVPDGLLQGSFGMAEETGAMMNRAINKAAAEKCGYGAGIAGMIRDKDLPHKENSIMYNALMLNIPVTIHVAIGNDIIHQHPECNGAALGETSYRDFTLLTDTVSRIGPGAVLNVGSAVLMPEVFLKSLTITRNLGFDIRGFTTANFDFLNMYRPRTRIVEWPRTLEAQGFDIRGDHKDTLTALHSTLTQ